jgi:tRNA 2-selenouridine synthase
MYCWRGGMRSNSMALLLSAVGLDITVLQKGYKAYRNWALNQFDKPLKLINIGGYTGTGKTDIIHALSKIHKGVIDLEGMANHKGSTFGNLEQKAQPTSEQFENELALLIADFNLDLPIFIEDESRNIGNVNIPNKLYEQLRNAPLIFLYKDREQRIKLLAPFYGEANKEQAKAAFKRIEKRLGGQNLKKAIAAIDTGNAQMAIDVALDYYDRYYYKGLEKRKFSRMIKLDANRPVEDVVNDLMQRAKTLYPDE